MVLVDYVHQMTLEIKTMRIPVVTERTVYMEYSNDL